MKALTLTQPWATLIAIGAKRFETRSWSTSVRGPVAIHAAKGFGPLGGKQAFVDVCSTRPFSTALTAHGLAAADLPLGAIVAVATLAQSAPAEKVREYLEQVGRNDEIAFGDYSHGRHAYELTNVRLVEPAIPCTGALGFWDVPLIDARLA